MDKFNLKDHDVQQLEFTNRKMIKSFYEYNIDSWRQDICRFDEYMKNVTIDIIEKICIFSWDITCKNVQFKIDIYLNNGTKRDFPCNYEIIMKWLKSNCLIE